MLDTRTIAVFLGITLTSILTAQPSANDVNRADKSAKARIAVVEFTPGEKSMGMTYEAKRQVQASIAFSLYETQNFDVIDVRHTRDATQAILPTLNHDGPTTAVVKIGKQLGVSYVLTGTVTEYNLTDGRATMHTRLIEVATGDVKYSGEISQHSASKMSARAGAAEMMTKVLKPGIQSLTEKLTERLR